MLELVISTGIGWQQPSMRCTLVNLFSCACYVFKDCLKLVFPVQFLLCCIQALLSKNLTFVFRVKDLPLFKGGIAILPCGLGYSKNQMDNHTDMWFLFCPLKSYLVFIFMVCLCYTSLQNPVMREHVGTLPHKGASTVMTGLPLLSNSRMAAL